MFIVHTLNIYNSELHSLFLVHLGDIYQPKITRGSHVYFLTITARKRKDKKTNMDDFRKYKLNPYFELMISSQEYYLSYFLESLVKMANASLLSQELATNTNIPRIKNCTMRWNVHCTLCILPTVYEGKKNKVAQLADSHTHVYNIPCQIVSARGFKNISSELRQIQSCS